MASTGKRSWKNLWIDPHYQGRFIVWVTLPTVVITVASLYGIRGALEATFHELTGTGALGAEAQAALLQRTEALFTRATVLAASASLLVALAGLILSHRTAGALYHFRRVFREVREGRHDSRIRLRKHDDFQHVAAEANGALDALTGHPPTPPLR